MTAGRAGGGAWPDRLAVRPAAVVLDCDGLLVDTEPSWGRLEQQVYADRGREYGPADRARYLGLSVADVAAVMAGVFGEPGGERALYQEMVDRIGVLLEGAATALPGARELVAGLAERGIPLAVASNSPGVVVGQALRLAGLAGVFPVVVSADDVARPKPAPDLYLEACARLGVAPAAAVAFEDSETGAAAAAAAGLAVVRVPGGAGRVRSDWQLPSLADPALKEWLASFS